MTERELLLELIEHFRLAAEDADRLAKGERGPIYVQFRARLKQAEFACRQTASWRADARWLQVGLRIEAAHQMCGQWLREKAPGWRFAGLAQILRRGEASATKLAHSKTERLGPILPIPKADPAVQQRPVQVILPKVDDVIRYG